MTQGVSRRRDVNWPVTMHMFNQENVWRVSRVRRVCPCARTHVKATRRASRVSCMRARLLTLLTKYWPASWEMSVSFYRCCRIAVVVAAATIIVGCSNRKFTQKHRRKISAKILDFLYRPSFSEWLKIGANEKLQSDRYVDCALIRVKDERHRED